MGQASSIEWTDATWNPVLGCTKVSAGCKNCYAERMSMRLAAMARACERQGREAGRLANYQRVVSAAGHWNRRVFLDYDALATPQTWKLPRTIFVNSMSDLFHPDVPLSFIQRTFDVMQACPQHVFQVLTKRPGRAASLRNRLSWAKNVWIGTSVEDQAVVHRVRSLQKMRTASVRFLSVEPLLGPIPRMPLAGIDWVIVGGESGPRARPIEYSWVRQIRDRCEDRGVPFFFKQWGGTNKKRNGRTLDGRTWDDLPVRSR